MNNKNNTAQVKTDRKALVVRHNKLIESKHKLTLSERRFVLWIVSQIKKTDQDLKSYVIKIKDWEKFIGIKSTANTYKEIYKMADHLTQRNVGIMREEGKGFVFFPWFYKIEYIPGKGEIEAKIHPELRPFLLELKEQYTAITLEYSLLLKNTYGQRIYDLLKQYQKIGERIISIEYLKEILRIEGKYKKYKDFRIRVIESAQKEINKKTDISFDFFPIKEGRKIVSIRFEIHISRPEVTLDNKEEVNPQSKTLFQKLLKHGVQEKMARDLVGSYEGDRVKWHIDEYETRMKSEKKPEGVGWLVKGIKEDYRPQKSIFEEEERKDRKKRAKAKLKKQTIEKEADKIKEECDHQNKVRIHEIIEEMVEAEKTEMFEFIKSRYGSYGSVFNIAKKVDSEGVSNPIIFGLCYEYVKERHPQVITPYIDFATGKKGVKKAVLEELKKTI